MKKIVLTIVVLLLLLAAYLTLWPVPIKPVSWNAPMPPGYTGPHAVNTKLANLKMISLGQGRRTGAYRHRQRRQALHHS